jgi:hypothetical protein
MSFNRLKNDTCTYKYDLKQAVGPGEYMLAEPNIDCQTCFEQNPELRMSNNIRRSTGVSTCRKFPLIDVDSEMKNIHRPATKCPSRKYRGESYCESLNNFPDCAGPGKKTEPTRLSNPPCTLRGTGWNRWEWLCKNPQEKALIPFDFNISGRILAKDNHRPCVADPLKANDSLPPTPPPFKSSYSCAASKPEQFSTHWRECNTYSEYMR